MSFVWTKPSGSDALRGQLGISVDPTHPTLGRDEDLADAAGGSSVPSSATIRTRALRQTRPAERRMRASAGGTASMVLGGEARRRQALALPIALEQHVTEHPLGGRCRLDRDGGAGVHDDAQTAQVGRRDRRDGRRSTAASSGPRTSW